MAVRVIPLSQIKEPHESYDKKVNDLVDLINRGFDVAESFVITKGAFLDFLKENGLDKKIEHLMNSGGSKHAEKHINSAVIPGNLMKEILKAYKAFGTTLEDAEVDLNGEKIKGDNALIEKVRERFITSFKENRIPLLLLQKIHFGKHGKLRTSSKFINSIFEFSKEELLEIEKLIGELKKFLFLPHEIHFTLSKNKIYISKIKPESLRHNITVQETHYKILNNSAL